MINQPLEILILTFPAIIFSLCVHEFSHGIVAYYYGDETAYRQGRLTLNPLKHLDPMGTIMLLLVGFGYAKPVPVNPYNLKNPRSEMIQIAAAGPLSNLILAFLAVLIMQIMDYTFLLYVKSEFLTEYCNAYGKNEMIFQFLYFFIFINIALAIFNLLPIHPLDGGQIFGNLISKKFPNAAKNLILYAPKVLFGVIIFGVITQIHIIFYVIEPIIIFIFTKTQRS